MSQEGWDNSLKYETDVPIPSAAELDPKQVLVKLHSASLNYRELMIPAVNVSATSLFLRIPKTDNNRVTTAHWLGQ